MRWLPNVECVKDKWESDEKEMMLDKGKNILANANFVSFTQSEK